MLFGRKINKDMSISEIVSICPAANSIFSKHGIKFIGKDLSPLESLEIVAKGNNLGDEQIKEMIKEINEEIKKQDKVGKNEKVIEVTDKAAEELKKILHDKGKKAFRLKLASDGCALYTYDFDFGTKAIGEEIENNVKGIRIFMPRKNVPMLKGTVIDYDEQRGGFVFNNPNVREDNIS